MTTDNRRIATILAAKLSDAGGSTAAARSGPRDIVENCIARHGGRAFGDGPVVVAEFADSLAAFDCGCALPAALRDGPGARIRVSVGLSFGDVADDGRSLHGDAVDRAKALRDRAGPDELLVGGAVLEQVRDKTGATFEQLDAPVGSRDHPAWRVTGANEARSALAFARELSRRQIFRAAGAYAIAAWVIVQAASIVFPEFDAPRWAMRTLITLLTVGFPLAMLVAWTVDVTGAGVVRTPDSTYSRVRGNALRIATVGIASLAAAAVLWWVWADYLEPDTRRPQRAAIKGNLVLAVSSPRKLSGPAELDWLGEGVANLLRNDLAESRHAIVLSRTRWQAVAGDSPGDSEVVAAARRAGVDYLVVGEYLETPDGIMLTTRVEDVENGNVILGSSVRAADPGELIARSAELAVTIKRALSLPLYDNVYQYAADFAVQNMAAYEAYVAGLGFQSRFDFQRAEESFRAALAIAPDYHMARFRLAATLEATGRSQEASDMLDAIPEDAGLTERERLYVAGAKAKFASARDTARSIEIYSELSEKYPYDVEAGQLLADAYWLDFQEDRAIALYERLAEMHSYDPISWMALGERLLDVGRLDDAQSALERYRTMAPDDHYAIALLGNLEQLQADYAASIELYEQSLALRPEFAVATLGLARSRYLIGEQAAAEALFAALIDDAQQPARFRIDAAFDLAGLLRGQGRFDAALRPLQAIEGAVREEGLFTAMLLSTLGLTELERGNLERAADLIAQSVEESPGVPTRYLFARGLLELRRQDYDAVRLTAAAIDDHAAGPDDPDRTERKAAAYLRGLGALQERDLPTASRELALAMDSEGYHYAVYELGLAELALLDGELTRAAELAGQALAARDPGDLRFDLELDRARAQLLHARILRDMGRLDDARAAATRFVQRWRSAGEDRPELAVAAEILAAD